VERHSHGKRWRVALVVVGLVLLVGLLAAVKVAQIGTLMSMGKQMQKDGPPPEAVSSTVARAQDWETTLSAVGTITSIRSVPLSNELPGTVTRILFQSGDIAREGQVLVELDASVEKAQLGSARARRDLAEKNAQRARKLTKGEAMTRQQLDEAETALAAATTDVNALNAQVDRKVVRAPFAGRLGIRAVNVGQYLNPGTTVTTLDALGATFVDFPLPQDAQAAVRVGQPVRVTAPSWAKPMDAKISAIDPTIDPATRNIKLRATIPGHDPRPGMFVTVEVVQPKQERVVIVPATAVVHAPYGDSVFIIEAKKPGSPGMDRTPDGKAVMIARQQFVRVGRQRGDFIAIAKGVRAGQTLVTAGAFKLRNNAPVTVDNRVAATPHLDPVLENR
jgi:membrane fusion protein (multidrug efflux system)